MQFARSIVVVVGLFVFSWTVLAQDSTDYNDGLKQQLKQEDAPATPPKKVVHKRIRKADKDQAAKAAEQRKQLARKKVAAKQVSVAQASDDASVRVKEDMEVETVRPAKVQQANDNSEAPALGESTNNTQKYGYQPPQYQPIFILQPTPAQQVQGATSPAAVGGAPVAQVQPTTNVDSTSVAEPKSEQLRHQREDLEHQTESKLIEKLEDDRMTAEKTRAERLFPAPQPSPVASPAPMVAPVAVASPAPVAAAPGVIAVEVAPVASPAPAVAAAPVPAPAPAPEMVKSEQAAVPAAGVAPAPQAEVIAVQGDTTAKADAAPVAKPEDDRRFTVGAMAGLPSYPTVTNITSYYTLGVMGTYKIQDHLAVETAFDYSKFDIKNVNYCPFCFGGTLVKGMDQYNFSVGLNYNLLTGPITPVAGVLVDFTRRSYSDRVDYGYTYGTPTGSNAFDGGLMAGVDLKLSQSMTLGFQFAYLWNLSYWTDDPLAYGLYGPIYGSPIESLSYYLATLNLRFMF